MAIGSGLLRAQQLLPGASFSMAVRHAGHDTAADGGLTRGRPTEVQPVPEARAAVPAVVDPPALV
jgi:hypothetical protein